MTAGSSRSSHLSGRKASLAIDLGGESCRVSLLRWQGDSPQIQMMHRFANAPFRQKSGLHWNLDAICRGLLEGLQRAAEIASEGIASIGVDGWAVDYVRLDERGSPLGNPYCYRDERTVAAEAAVHERISPEHLRDITATERMRINTLYQLVADGRAGIDASTPWVNLPEYVLHWLGGRRVAEYTNATHTQLVDCRTRQWSDEIFRSLGLDLPAAPEMVPPGTIVGRVRREPLAGLPAYAETVLIAPACHDTASAIAGIPAVGSDWAYISSGTWSLVGALLDEVCNSRPARDGNYTNLGAVGGRICFHKNVNGMWLLSQCIEGWAAAWKIWSIPELVTAAESLAPSKKVADAELLDVDDPELLLAGNMCGRMNAQRKRRGWAPLSEDGSNAPAVADLIFRSLAKRYAQVLGDVAAITGKKLSTLYIVGGGSRNRMVNRLTESVTGLKVQCGPVESSTLGNFAVQLAALENSGQYGVTYPEVAKWASVLAVPEAAGAV